VDEHDLSLKNPTKFVGQFYPQEEAETLADKYDWAVKMAGKHGWRRVVGSPFPKSIINSKSIKQLVDSGTIVIAGGGGGIPVYIMHDGRYEGVDAVVDKDRAAAILGRDIRAQELIILTNIDKVYLDYGMLTQRPLDKMTLSQARKYLDQGQFPPGSMGPKIDAAISFLENGGERVIIAPLEKELEALRGEAGTWILPD
jgi:carbamate kinase